MVCDVVFNLCINNHFCAKAENLASLLALFTKLHPDFQSMCIYEFHSKAVVAI